MSPQHRQCACGYLCFSADTGPDLPKLYPLVSENLPNLFPEFHFCVCYQISETFLRYSFAFILFNLAVSSFPSGKLSSQFMHLNYFQFSKKMKLKVAFMHIHSLSGIQDGYYDMRILD